MKAIKADPKNAADYESPGDAHARPGDTGPARDAWDKARLFYEPADSSKH